VLQADQRFWGWLRAAGAHGRVAVVRLGLTTRIAWFRAARWLSEQAGEYDSWRCH
jgi:hypothetical protein